jgi:mannitol/fructose-specific phosphotransferase system IIA component (Ntr-type)
VLRHDALAQGPVHTGGALRIDSLTIAEVSRVLGVSMTEHTGDRLGYPVIDLPESVAVSTESVIRYMIGHLVEQGRISREHAARAACQVVTRENQGSSALGRGAAMPHSKSEVAGVVGLIGRSQRPLPWQASDGVAVHEVRLLLTPVDKPREAMQALKNAAEFLSVNNTDNGEQCMAPDSGGNK